ncbi:MAG: hypothetical protein J5994_08830 [Ruminococcus sp.]|nr:hypothetical protein [Ruminococcus sp.]
MKQPDVETAVRIYYSMVEISNKEIKELFKVGDTCAVRMKRKVRDEMAKRGVKNYYPGMVKTSIAFEVWGLDIEDLERRLKAIRRLKLNDI